MDQRVDAGATLVEGGEVVEEEVGEELKHYQQAVFSVTCTGDKWTLEDS